MGEGMDQGKEISEVTQTQSPAENFDEVDATPNEKISCVYLDRIEELEDGTAEAVLLTNEDDPAQIILPANFLPDDVSDGDYLTLKISYDEKKTQAALESARKLLNA